MASRSLPFFLTLGVLLVLFASPVKAFGAGNIINISQVEGNNFRHGDIEDTLLQLFMTVAGQKKFDELSVKRVYFGNFLRDYSQALDVGGLKQLPADTLRLLVWILSFMTFGYATAEFEVTADKLGVYRPEEHIDNPKDYADNEDARQYDPRLRAPVDERKELAVDDRNGMKVYIASDDRDCMTSAKFVRSCFERSIELGRKYRREGNDADFYEALRLLGTGSHTLEDFAAHSNYVELALRELGVDAFPHVGSQTELEVDGKRIWPCITGTFGMIDFLHSVVGEVTDKLTQSAVQELDSKITDAENQDSAGGLKSIFDKIPWSMLSGGEDQNFGGRMDEIEANSAAKQVDNKANITPKTIGGYDIAELQTQAEQTFMDVYPILEFHDQVMKAVTEALSNISGLNELIETLSGALQIFVFSMMAPFIKPVLNEAKELLGIGSQGVLNSSEKAQYIVWDDDNCTDPTHSVISKDHFTNVLNNPAGKVASSVVSFVAPIVVSCWDDENKDVNDAIDSILQVLHHPALRDRNKKGQQLMFETVQTWWEEKSRDQREELKEQLSRDGVRAGKNHTGEDPSLGGHGHSHAAGSSTTNYNPQRLNSQQQPQVDAQGVLSGSGIGGLLGGILGAVTGCETNQNEQYESGQSRFDNQGGAYGSGRADSQSHEGQASYGNPKEQSYGSGRQHRNDEDEQTYGGRHSRPFENEQPPFSSGRPYQDESESFGRISQSSYGKDKPSYGGSGHPADDNEPYGSTTHHGGYRQENEDMPSYSGRPPHREEEVESFGGDQRSYDEGQRHSGRHHREEQSEFYSGGRQTEYGREEPSGFDQSSSYRGCEGDSYGGRRQAGFDGEREQSGFQKHREEEDYGRGYQEGGLSDRQEGAEYGGAREDSGFNGRRAESGNYGGERNDDGEYGGGRRQRGYGGEGEVYGQGDEYSSRGQRRGNRGEGYRDEGVYGGNSQY